MRLQVRSSFGSLNVLLNQRLVCRLDAMAPAAGLRAFWDWDDLPGVPGKDDAKGSKVHIRMQQRNGRKSWTTVAGFPDQVRLPKSGKVLQVDFEKILRALKKTFKTNGVLIKDPDHGSVMQLQGDIRKEVAEFLIEVTAIITKDQVMIHGS
eukprot:s4633_g4.t1